MTAGKTKVIILGSGTSTGVPVIGCDCSICCSLDPKNQRSRASIYVQDVATGFGMVIDTTPDFRMQILTAGIKTLDAVLYTHTHADHCHGFDDLRAFYFQSKQAIPCYASARHESELRDRFSYAFSDTGYKGTAPQVIFHEIAREPFTVGPFIVQPVYLPHGSMETIGFRIGSFVYATDFKKFPDEIINSWRGEITTMIASAIHFSQHSTHSNIPETLALFAQLDVKQGFLSHLSHGVDYRRDSAKLPDHVSFAYDQQIIEF